MRLCSIMDSLAHIDLWWFAVRLGTAFVIATLLCRRALRKKSLSPSGARAAFAVALLSWSASVRFGITLIVFYATSTKLTRVGEEQKRTLDAGFKKGGQRSAGQVLACSAIGTAIAVVFLVLCGNDAPVDYHADWTRSFLLCAYLGHYACCNADTWASELGMLDPGWPWLITTGERVPPGTNGGVSTSGLIASLLGGALIGVVFLVQDLVLLGYDGHDHTTGRGLHVLTLLQLHLVTLGALSGLLGSVLDSLLGATVQATYYDTQRSVIVEPSAAGAGAPQVKHVCGRDWLDNHQVNFVSVLLTTLIAGFAGKPLLSHM